MRALRPTGRTIYVFGALGGLLFGYDTGVISGALLFIPKDFKLSPLGELKIGDRDGSGFHESEETTARDLVRQLSMHSYAGGMRVFVLGDADFTREAANALLKFFEEPPAHVLLIVTTNAVGRVMPTIRSRLVEVTFPLLSDPDREVLTAWGVYGEKTMYGRTSMGVIRSTFLVDAEGKIEDAQYGVKATGHVGRLLRDLEL